MVAVATTPRRGLRRPGFVKDSPTGRDAFVVVGANGVLYEQSQGTFALTRAQRLAEQAENPMTLTVERRTVAKQPVALFRVFRDADGVVWTQPLTKESPARS